MSRQTIPHLELRKNKYVAVFTKDGRRHRVSTGHTDATLATLALAQLLASGDTMPVPEGRPVHEAIELWADSLTAKGRTCKYVADCRRSVMKSLASQKCSTVEQITPSAIEEIRERMLASGQTIGTTNLKVAHLSSFCRWLWRTGSVKSDPTVNMAPIKNVKARKRRALTRDECRALLGRESIPYWHRRVYATMVLTGMRVAELSKLKWSDIGDDRIIRIVGKGGKPTAIPVCDMLAGILRDQSEQSRSEDGRVFPKVPSNGQFIDDARSVGIERVDSRGWIITRHSLRHTFNAMLYASGASTAERRALGRWSSDAMPDSVYLDSQALPMRETLDKMAEGLMPSWPVQSNSTTGSSDADDDATGGHEPSTSTGECSRSHQEDQSVQPQEPQSPTT